MKILILLLISFSLNAQNVYVSFHPPTDIGLGLRYDQMFERTGLYIAGSKTECRFYDVVIRNHYKVSLGGIVKMLNGNLNLGISYHKFGGVTGDVDPRVLKPVSFEAGCVARFSRFLCGFRFDPLKGTCCLDIGVRL